jgi:hypothetical protein
MSRQFGRECNVTVDSGGHGVAIEHLRIAFDITKTSGRFPNPGTVKIYNLSPDNERKIKGEFDDVIVNAGYHGATRVIFRGNIKKLSLYPEGTNRVTEIECGDGDKDLRESVINVTLAASTTNAQLLDHVMGTFTTTTKGHVVLKDRKRARGKVISAMGPDVLDDLAADSDANWSIQDAKLVMVPVDGVLPGEAILINADTGMLGTPVIDDKGIVVECQLNPQIAVHGLVKIDNNGIRIKALKTAQKKPGAAHPSKTKTKVTERLDPDGVYAVYKVQHKGDTHGSEWKTSVYCKARKAA